jgi:Ni/Fe-hydrogenase 1 B-type cytochrome subunit
MSASVAAQASQTVRVYVWEVPVRLTHWLIALSIVVLSVTGFYIGSPFIVSSGRATQRFVMGTMKAIHNFAAIVFTLSVLARIVWMFVGNRHARWDQFVPVPGERRRALIPTFLFYIFLRAKPPGCAGHNPLAGASYVAVFFLYLVMIASGLGLYAVSAHLDSPLRGLDFLLALFGGAQTARWVHHVVMWLLLGFAVHHVYSSILMDHVEKSGTVASIVSGYKFLPSSEIVEHRRTRAHG